VTDEGGSFRGSWKAVGAIIGEKSKIYPGSTPGPLGGNPGEAPGDQHEGFSPVESESDPSRIRGGVFDLDSTRIRFGSRVDPG
jgi:hypothetical protein